MSLSLAYFNTFSFRKLIVTLVFSFVLLSCSEKVDIYSTGHPVPIVYCLLDPTCETQYVRVGKSYQAGDASAVNPPVPDSTVWNITHEVYIEEYENGKKENIYRFAPDSTIKKDTGFFPDTNLRVYSAEFRPIGGKTYQLYVFFPELNLMAAARTIVHEAPDIVDPLSLSIRKITFETGLPYTIRWYPGQNTGVYLMTFRIHYRDSTAAGLEVNSADYTSEGYFEQRTQQMLEYNMSGGGFYSAMAQKIPIRNGVVRSVASVEFIMVTGGTDLGFLYRTSIEQGSNFTNLSDYTNIGNGIGIFSSRIVTKVLNLSLSNLTLDQLARSDLTSSLGFTDSKGK